jgi:transposase
MTKTYILKTPTQTVPAERSAVETYLAPPPPSKGKIIGLDCHPDTFTAAVFVGQTPHDARKIGSRENLSLEALLKWAAAELTPQDIILMEAGSNSFELCKRLGNMGLKACVLESCHVGKHAKTYADNDKMAAARIALVYLAGNAPCVWVPDEQSRERRELLHAYRKAVDDHTAATNSIKSYLNGRGIRLGKHSLDDKTTSQWIFDQADWSVLQKNILAEHLANITESKERRKRLYRLIAAEIADDPTMMRCMKVLGVGIVSAFALLAVIGDIGRFHSPEKLVAYIGLNPGQRQSGKGKDIRLGVGRRGRGDIRHLLIQGAHAIMRSGRNTPLGQWGWKLFARKGNRNVAVAAIARKLLVQVWHLLHGNPPLALESDTSFRIKLQKLAVALGSTLRTGIGLGKTLEDTVKTLLLRCQTHPEPSASPRETPQPT